MPVSKRGRKLAVAYGIVALARRIGLLLCVVTGILFVPVPAQQLVAPEHEVKATWLLNLTRFVEWPSTAFEDNDSPFVVGVMGKELPEMDLEKTFGDKPIKGRRVQIKRVSNEQEIRGCQLLFITSSERRRTRDLLDKLKGQPVLTVGETEDFLDYGGVINLLVKDESLQLEIDLNAAQKAGLRLNANLLKIAKKARGKYE